LSWEGGVSAVWAEKRRRSLAITTEDRVEVMTTEGVMVQLKRERQGREREEEDPLGPL